MKQVVPSCEVSEFERVVSMPETISKTGMLIESVVITLANIEEQSKLPELTQLVEKLESL